MKRIRYRRVEDGSFASQQTFMVSGKELSVLIKGSEYFVLDVDTSEVLTKGEYQTNNRSQKVRAALRTLGVELISEERAEYRTKPKHAAV